MCQVHLWEVCIALDVGHSGDVKLTHLQKIAYTFIFGSWYVFALGSLVVG